MSRQLKDYLNEEIEKWSRKSYLELREELREPISYYEGTEDERRRIEVYLLESTDDYVHVGIGVDQGGWFRALVPMSYDFLVYKDGRVDK